ncbi:hypothetical protein O9992_29005 [Vibrio lentus]|nr:hypothetical protein [Vibrio lentus]
MKGRNNLGVVSLNLPRIAINAKQDMTKFYELLDEKLKLARRALETRISRLENVKARVAPILYMEGACGVRLKADDIADIFKNGHASVSLGYIGIHEAVLTLYGTDVHLYDDGEMRAKALELVEYMKREVEFWTKKRVTRSAYTAHQ